MDEEGSVIVGFARGGMNELNLQTQCLTIIELQTLLIKLFAERPKKDCG